MSIQPELFTTLTSSAPDIWPLLYWMLERHRIYLRRINKEPWPWTEDTILQEYKFTNVFRELDKVTLWMRENFVGLHTKASPELIIFNCCIFRRFGTIEFAQALGWVNSWEPKHVCDLAQERLRLGKKTFTGAYNIPNMGLSLSKPEVVVFHTLAPIWGHIKEIAKKITSSLSLEESCKAFFPFKGWGGSGFMAYEVISDLRWTPVLCNAKDILTWANPGVGARRGLNRLFGRPVKSSLKSKQALEEMQWLFYCLREVWPIEEGWGTLEMREVEHSLCEFDKYERLRLGEGSVRAKYTYTEDSL